MNKKLNRRKRRKRIIIAYAARTACVLVLLCMLILMGCGCLYIYEHVFQKDDTKKEDDVDKNKDADKNKDDQTNNDDSSDDNFVDTSTTPLTPFTYPDASGLTVVLDAGHGGGDGGTVGEINGIEAIEKDINLSVVQKMKALLEECGATVILTRAEDERLSLSDRNYISNQTGADLFVSIHCNSFEDDASIAGLECYYHKKSETSKQYATELIAIANRIGNIKARYEMEQNYQVLRDSTIPAILVEMGYLTNRTDCKNLMDTNYQDTMAQTLVTAIVEILKDTN